MTKPHANGCLHKNRIAIFFAAFFIVLGLVLQWTELLYMRLLGHDAWLFATLFSEIWNIINVSLSTTQWHQTLHYWPLLLVITGAVILFSRCPRKSHSNL